MSAAPRYVLAADETVTAEVAARSTDALRDLGALYDLLIVSTTSALAGAVVERGEAVPTYRAPFDDAWLTYSVTRDPPTIHPLSVLWNRPLTR